MNIFERFKDSFIRWNKALDLSKKLSNEHVNVRIKYKSVQEGPYHHHYISRQDKSKNPDFATLVFGWEHDEKKCPHPYCEEERIIKKVMES